MSTVLWMPSAVADLQDIQEYISKDSVFYANKFVDDAFAATEMLEIFPEIGRVVPELGIEMVREIFHGSYRIIYELFNDKAHVIAVVHGKRPLPDISRSSHVDSIDIDHVP